MFNILLILLRDHHINQKPHDTDDVMMWAIIFYCFKHKTWFYKGTAQTITTSNGNGCIMQCIVKKDNHVEN